MAKTAHGRTKLTLDFSLLNKYLDLDKQNRKQLYYGFYNPRSNNRSHMVKIDYSKLLQEYKSLLETGTVKNKADLARRFSVSRSWITKVFKLGA